MSAPNNNPHVKLQQIGPYPLSERDLHFLRETMQTIYDDYDNGVPIPVPELEGLIRDCNKGTTALYFRKPQGPGGQTYGRFNLLAYPPSLCFLGSCLEELELNNAPHVVSLPPGFENLQKLRKLSIIRNTSLASLEPLPPNLEELVLNQNDSLAHLPEDLPQNLKRLISNYNDSLTLLPENLPPNLEELDIKGTQIRVLPVDIGSLKRLKIFRASLVWISTFPASFGKLSALEEFDTGLGRFGYQVPEFVQNLPRLQKICTSPYNLEYFDPDILDPAHLRLRSPIRGPVALSMVSQCLSLLPLWQSLTRLDICLENTRQYEYEGPPIGPSLLTRTLRSLPLLKELNLFLQPRGVQSNAIQVSMSELSSLEHIEEIGFCFNILVVFDATSDTLSFPRLVQLVFWNCRVEVSQLKRLHSPLLKLLKFHAVPEFNDAFESLCMSWFPHLENLQTLALISCGITSLTRPCIQTLAKMNIRELGLGQNPIVEGSEDEVEKRLLPLVKSCKSLTGLCILPAERSKRIEHFLFMNEARTKVLGGQRMSVSLWSIVFENASKAFRHGDPPRKPSEPDAIFHLLRSRAALDLFGGPA